MYANSPEVSLSARTFAHEQHHWRLLVNITALFSESHIPSGRGKTTVAGFLFLVNNHCFPKTDHCERKKPTTAPNEKEEDTIIKTGKKRKKKSTKDQQSKDLHHSTHCCTILHCPFYYSALCPPTAHTQHRLWPRPTTPTAHSADAKQVHWTETWSYHTKTIRLWEHITHIYMHSVETVQLISMCSRVILPAVTTTPRTFHFLLCCIPLCWRGLASNRQCVCFPGWVSWEASADARDIDSCLYVWSGNVINTPAAKVATGLSVQHIMLNNSDNYICFLLLFLQYITQFLLQHMMLKNSDNYNCFMFF